MKKFTKLLDAVKNADFILMTLSTVICSGLSFIFNVYSRREVAKIPLGIYSTCIMIQNYMNYAQFGIFNSYNRDYPQALGRKDYESAQKMKNATMTFMLMIYMAIFVLFDAGVLVYHFSDFGGKYKDYYVFGLAMCPIMILLKSFDDMSNTTLRMHGQYNKVAIIGFIRSLMAFAVGMVAITYGGYYGLYAMAAVSAILGIIFFHKGSLKGAKLDFDFPYMKMMIISGIPLLINGLIWTIVQNVDKHVIRTFMTVGDLGIYSVAQMGFTTMVLIPLTISNVFYVKISHIYGANQNERELLDKASHFTSVVSALSGVVCLIVFYITPLFVNRIMPDKADGTEPTQILVIGVAIYATTMIYGNIFSVLKLNKTLINNSIALCIFNIIFSTVLVAFVEESLNMVAIGTGISYALYSLLLIIKLSKKLHYSFTKLIIKSWGPAVAIIIPGLLIYLLVM